MIRSLHAVRWRRLHLAACAVLALGLTSVAVAPAWVRASAGDPTATNRSEDPAAVAAAERAAAEAAVCQDGEPLPSAGQVIEEVVRQLQAEQAATGADDVVVLNGRGYNYGPPRGIEIDPLLLRREARQAR